MGWLLGMGRREAERHTGRNREIEKREGERKGKRGEREKAERERQREKQRERGETQREREEQRRERGGVGGRWHPLLLTLAWGLS